jgi:aminoglycoside phosphotransferase (APT) family kinase protein
VDPLRAFPSRAQLNWVERTVGGGAVVTGGRRMLGGITSSVHRLSVHTRTGTRQVVLKRFSDPRIQDASAIVANETAALSAVEATAVPAPRVLGASPDGRDTDGVPSLLMTRAPGRVWLGPDDLHEWVGQLAALVPVIHGVPADAQQPSPREAQQRPIPQSASRPDLWRAAGELVATMPPDRELVRTHGDYQHFNVLWSRGRLSALVDWSSSSVAAPERDVGHCRLNLAVLFSAELAEDLRHAYEAEAGRPVDPWWDVDALLAYDDAWRTFIPVQVAGRAPVDIAGMTGRVEELLARALART